MENATDFFAETKLSKAYLILIPRFVIDTITWELDLVSYNSGGNRARNFKSASRFALVRFWTYSCVYFLNCTTWGPVTITTEVTHFENKYLNSNQCRKR